MKKSKLLKSLGFASLALLMGATGIFAFTTLPATASESRTNISGLGLDPKNDPVVYTTESGLEIRMSNATKYSGTSTFTTNTGYTWTQDLRNFYYFTMGTYSGKIYTYANASTTASYTCTNVPVNWIILGLGQNTGYFLDEVSKNLFSTWKSNLTGIQYPTENPGAYFFSNIYENYSPAGELIDSVISAKTYIMDKVKASITNHSDIPDGCMLVLSEKLLGQMYFNSKGAINDHVINYNPTYFGCTSSGYWGNRYRYFANANSSSPTWTTSGNVGGCLYNYINNLFNKNISTGLITGSNNLGFTQEQAELIIPQQLYTHYSNASSSLQESPATDGGTYYTMFPLAYRSINTSIKQNFCIEDYLPNANQRMACLIGSTQSFWYATRSGQKPGDSSRYICDVQPNGNYLGTDARWVDNVGGVRPAFVMKLN